ncbi:ferritin-like domain-containing protein [Amphibiibacter pelophylacis]|uniref:Ferritin-like domain-containing protein n=1 Tax=Amphibiibacter pelophylacis TaxID=1799477 RepID=A0ACC6P071_9BURK
MKDLFDLSARRDMSREDRRNFFRRSAGVTAGLVGGAVLSACGGSVSEAIAQANAPSESDVLNFALNLEYLEAQFYLRAVGRDLEADLKASGDTMGLDGVGTRGAVTGGRAVNFTSKRLREYAQEIAEDEFNHVRFLRKALGAAAVSQPAIDLQNSFNAAAKAAGVGDSFDPYADETSFMIGAFVFEDVGVTAYKGAAGFLAKNAAVLDAAAGIMAVEAYHAGLVRGFLVNQADGVIDAANKISAIRGAVSSDAIAAGMSNGADQGITVAGVANVVPTDANGIAYSRTPNDVLRIVYLNADKTAGGFFPAGVNGAVA